MEEAVAAGASDAEAWAQSSQRREVRVHGGEVESLTEATERGVGVRAWVGDRAGYAYGTDLSPAGLGQVGAAAGEAARVADPDRHAGPPEPGPEPPEIEGLRDDSVGSMNTGEVVDLAKAVERTALERDKRIAAVEEVVYVDADEEVVLSPSSGGQRRFSASHCYAYLQALAGEASERQTGLGFGVARGPAGLEPVRIGEEAADEAVAMLGAEKPRSRSCPAVLSDRVAASFVGFLGSALCADQVQRGRSPFAHRLGDEIASPALAVADDGLDPEGLASSPFDGEGRARGRTELVGERRLLAYLYDSYTARRGGAEPTGNAARSSYRSAPSVAPSNLVLEAGDASLGDLLAEAAGGVYVTEVAGLHSGVNPVTGRFSVGASGHRVDGGRLAGPLREFTIAGDLVELLGDVRAVGAEARWVPFGGSVRSVPMLVGELAIGGG
jgi:PmbA protein